MKCDCTRLWKNLMASEWKIRTKFALKFCREVTFLAPLVAEIRPTVETCWAVGAAAQHLCSTEQTSRHPQQKYQLFCNKTHCHAIKKDLTAFCCQSNEYWLSKVMMLLLKILAKKKKIETHLYNCFHPVGSENFTAVTIRHCSSGACWSRRNQTNIRGPLKTVVCSNSWKGLLLFACDKCGEKSGGGKHSTAGRKRHVNLRQPSAISWENLNNQCFPCRVSEKDVAAQRKRREGKNQWQINKLGYKVEKEERITHWIYYLMAGFCGFIFAHAAKLLR